MVSQQRAAQTRTSLIRAAATAFQQNGYAGTALAEVARNAGVTMGALTFHFPAKQQLAREVVLKGAEFTACSLRAAQLPPGLPGVVALTYVLSGLLAEDVTVRATARLAEEGEEFRESWLRTWDPMVVDFLSQARKARSIPLALPVESIALLVRHVVVGMACAARSAPGRQEGLDLPEQFRAIWQLVFSDALGGREPPFPARIRG